MKEKMKRIARSNITFGVVMGTAFWGIGKLMDKTVNKVYNMGFLDGVDTCKAAVDTMNEVNDK